MTTETKEPKLKAYPSALRPYDLGAHHVWDEGRVEVTEKLDGSQFCWSYYDGALHVRSKGGEFDVDKPQHLFQPAVAHVRTLETLLRDEFQGYVFYGEAMARPRHNVISYGSLAQKHIMLFGVRASAGHWLCHDELAYLARLLGIDVAPLLMSGPATDVKAELERRGEDMMKTTSYLGGANIEGYVVRNLDARPTFKQHQWPFTAVKYVSDNFKEVSKAKKIGRTPHSDPLTVLLAEFAAEARWIKAVQRAEEEGTLTGGPADIGPLVKSVQADVFKEEEEYIKERLFAIYRKEVAGAAVKGLPEWYKARLLKQNNPSTGEGDGQEAEC